MTRRAQPEAQTPGRLARGIASECWQDVLRSVAATNGARHDQS